ncbi:MAG: hypothetical protein R2726_13755 [Acidimicrobiales bacterium]
MLWVLVGVAVVAVVVIGLVAVGKVTAELAAQPPRSVFELEDAVTWVADELPSDVQARLSYRDVQLVLECYLDYMEMKGVAFEGEDAGGPSGPLVADDDEGLAFVIGRVADLGLDDVGDVDVAEVLTATEAYLAEIGAIGGRVPGPEDPLPGS